MKKQQNAPRPYFAYRSFWKEFEAMKKFAGLGVKEFCIFAGNSTNSLGEPYSQYKPVWLWYDSYDFAPLDEQIGNVLKICPDARILCLIDLNSPLWLARQLMLDSYLHLTGALCKPLWRRETEKYLKAFVDHVEKVHGSHIENYILMCGKTDEWMDVSKGSETPDTFAAYQEWCRKEGYPDPEDVPTFRERSEGIPLPCGCTFRDPEKQENAIRYWKFMSGLVAEGIGHFTKIVREKAAPERKIGVFYGYQLQLKSQAATLGHLAYEKVESLPTVDFVISPGKYADREMGGASGFMTPNGTVHLHGKGCLYEIDHRTTTANMQLTKFVSMDWMVPWKNEAEDIAGIRREFCRTLFHGSHLWWFDMWGGFFNQPHQQETIRQCREIWEKYADGSFEPESEIVLIVDPESAFYFPDSRENEPLYDVQHTLARIGAPFRAYTLNNIGSLPAGTKMAVFASTAQITPEQKHELEAKMFGKVRCVWCGPCGITDGKTMTETDLPGLRFEKPGAATVSELRAEAEKAGVHLFTEEDDPVWYGRDLLMIHTVKAGTRTIRLPREAVSVTELFSGKSFPAAGNGFQYTFASPETALFKIGK